MQLKLFIVLLVIAALVVQDGSAWGRRRRRRRRSWSLLPRCPRCSVPTRNNYVENRFASQRMMQYSSLTYHRSRRSVEAWNCRACKQFLAGFSNRGYDYDRRRNLVAISGYDPRLRAIVVAFRGTEVAGGNLRNWIRVNLRLRAVRTSSLAGAGSGKIHRGFLGAFLAMRSRVARRLSNLRRSYGFNTPVYFTGHSLGGALATLAALEFRATTAGANRVRDVRMINFGSPLVGDACFVNSYARHVTQSLRYAHSNDIVTKVPLRIWPLCYRHVPRHQRDTVTKNRKHSTYLGVPVVPFFKGTYRTDRRGNLLQ